MSNCWKCWLVELSPGKFAWDRGRCSTHPATFSTRRESEDWIRDNLGLQAQKTAKSVKKGLQMVDL